MTSEKDNGFNVMLKWRYEDSGAKLVQLKRKIQMLKDKLTKERETLKSVKESYERLLNCKGSDGELLIELWGLQCPPVELVINSPSNISAIDESNPTITSAMNSLMSSPESAFKRGPGRLARSIKKKPLGKISQNGSRSNSLMNETKNTNNSNASSQVNPVMNFGL